jgi:ParB/RepB/Spo0J family partition protein
MGIIENLQREDLSLCERANGYMQLKDMYGMTQENIARIVKKMQSTIAEIMALNYLPEPIYKKVLTSELSRSPLIDIDQVNPEEDMIKL